MWVRPTWDPVCSSRVLGFEPCATYVPHAAHAMPRTHSSSPLPAGGAAGGWSNRRSSSLVRVGVQEKGEVGIGDRVRLGLRLRARDRVRDGVRDRVRARVRARVRDGVRDRVRARVA